MLLVEVDNRRALREVLSADCCCCLKFTRRPVGVNSFVGDVALAGLLFTVTTLINFDPEGGGERSRGAGMPPPLPGILYTFMTGGEDLLLPLLVLLPS